MEQKLKIGRVLLDNPLVLAPLAGITDMAFRLLAKQSGCALVVSEMISSAGLHYAGKNTFDILTNSPDEVPLSMQIFGSDPAMMAEAAVICCERGATIIDINMGCPVRKVIKSGSGIALMRNQELAVSIVAAVRKAIEAPLTVKIRLGPYAHTPNAVPFAQAMADAGADAIAVHGRFGGTRFTSPADWSGIAEVVKALSVPVIGNGDVKSGADARRMMETTGAMGVMVGRAALGQPWIFREMLAELAGRKFEPLSVYDRLALILKHLELLLSIKPEATAVREFRKHLCWYTKGLAGGSMFRSQLAGIETRKDLVEHIGDFFNRRPKQGAGRERVPLHE